MPYRVCCTIVPPVYSADFDSLPNILQSRVSVLNDGFWIFDSVILPADKRDRLLHEWTKTECSLLSDSNQLLVDTDLPKWDKCYWVVIERSGNSWLLRIRELDVRTRFVSGDLMLSVATFDKMPDAIVESLGILFSPVARIEKVAKDTASLRFLGGELFSKSNWLRAVNVGDVFIPFVRTLDMEKNVKSISRIPYTGLIVNDTPTESTIKSGLRFPLNTRRRGRNELIAIRPFLPKRSTQLQIVSKKSTENAESLFPPYSVEEKTDDANMYIGKTSTDGRFRIPEDEKIGIRTILIRQNHVTLARFPLINGLDANLEIRIADDPQRLAAESALISIQERIIEQTANREILTLQLENQNAKGLSTLSSETEIKKLVPPHFYLSQLEMDRVKHKSIDATVQKRIDRMFSETILYIKNLSNSM